MTEHFEFVVLGAGPTGLGAATRLQQHQHDDWVLFEQDERAGGLACTDATPQGFLFDMGGHVIFSHYAYFDDLLDKAVGEENWNHLQRVSYIRLKGRWVPYPFQNNLGSLDTEDQVSCLQGLVEAKVACAVERSKPRSFDDWICRYMGRGIADLFMRPYNFKVWAVPTSAMQCDWLGERVAGVDVQRALENVLQRKDDPAWGPNATFRFPKRGGTGHIWSQVAGLLPQDKLRFGCKVTSIDPDTKTLTFESGATASYNKLISTLPLDVLCGLVREARLAAGLHFSSTHVVGLGLRGPCPHGQKCWLYFPEDNCPYYRCTVFSNYAAENCPGADTRLPTLCMADGAEPDSEEERPGPYWSLMFEVSESRTYKNVDSSATAIAGMTWPRVVLDTMLGAIETDLVTPAAEVVSIFHRRIERGYPTPTLDRDSSLAAALPALRAKDIWSRGRFGSWKYEVANQDHSMMLGVEAVDNALFGAPENTLNHPEIVNAKKNVELRWR